MEEDGVSVEADMRGKHGNKPRSLLPEAKKTMIDFILSHKVSESYYRRVHTAKRYFDSRESMRKMRLEVLAKIPLLKQTVPTQRIEAPLLF